MRPTPVAAQLIERYLLSRGRRYFRGHHDGEYFFILTVGDERLHVHLELAPTDPDRLTIRVAPSYFFPAADRARLVEFVDSWNQSPHRVAAVIHESSDPTRLGVSAENTSLIALDVSFDDFAGLVDQTIGSSIRLFGELPLARNAPCMWVLDAG
ncbi:MAG TPA: hypothetical protein VH496_11700 [Mycobacterium sp.]|jgi:hypothetical protein